MRARDFVLLGGGKAANVAYFARCVGVPAVLLARLGNDILAEVALENLGKSGVDLSHVCRVEGAATGVAMISVQSDGDKAIIMASNANTEWRESDASDAIAAVMAAPAGSLLVADLELPAFVIERSMQAARNRGFKTVLDPSPAERMMPQFYALADVLTPNLAEARQLTDQAIASAGEAERAAAMLRQRGTHTVLVKLTRGDSVLCSADESRHLKSVPVKAVDTTGAGDAFAAALALGLMEGRSMRDATMLAMAASSIAVEIYGAQPAYPDRASLEARFGQIDLANRH
jgi:ribokinase